MRSKRSRAGRAPRRSNPTGAQVVTVGDRNLVIMDEEEYDRLLDVADAAEARRIKADAADPVLTWDQVKDRFLQNRVAEVRRSLGVSQRQLAKRMGVKPSTVSRWERKDANLTLSTIRKIARAMRADIHDLIA
jgi:DNA-binding XRE family transcriptional regulator